MNKVFILGRIGQDPVLKNVGSSQVTKFSVATGFKKTSGEDHTDWHNIECWGKNAELASKYLSKGRQVAIEGQIRYSTSEKDGKKTYFTSIIADRLEFIGDRQEPKQEVKEPILEEPSLDDIPF